MLGRRISRCFRNARHISSSARRHGETAPASAKLSELLPGIPPMVYGKIDPTRGHGITKVSVLENGLTVASENKFGQFVTVGVLSKSGSRFEVGVPSGITHFLEKLSFSSTSKFQDRDDILQLLEKHGGICDSQGTRDTFVQAVSANHSGLAEVMDILSDVHLRPLITNEELEGARQAILFELESFEMQHNPEAVLMDLIHQAAYRDNTLGLPRICPRDGVSNVDQSALYKYLSAYHGAERTVVAGVGMEHEELVELAKETFLKKQPIWAGEGNMKGDNSLAQYTGGEAKISRDMGGLTHGPNPLPELAHVVIGLQSGPHTDLESFVPFCVLNLLMGGGGSFSAGGPGKGMYTRLYLNVLNRFHWIYNATAYNHAYDDSGLFCIHAGCTPEQVGDLVRVITQEMINMGGTVGQEELARAKTQLKSMLLMNLEARPVAFEDIGRQVLVGGKRQSAEYFCQLIDAVTEDDIRRVTGDMLQSQVSVAAVGDLSRLPSYESIQDKMSTMEVKSHRRFSIFK